MKCFSQPFDFQFLIRDSSCPFVVFRVIDYLFRRAIPCCSTSIMPPFLTLFIIFLAIYLIAECVNLFVVGTSLSRGVIGIFRRRRHGSKSVELSKDLKIAAANRLLTVGSELVVGTEHEWDEFKIKRFAVSPTAVDAEPGTVMQVVRLTRDRMELIPVVKDKQADATNNDSSESRPRHDT